MRNRSCQIAVLVTVAALAAAVRAAGDGGCCVHCGCGVSCEKVCRLVCEEKKVDVVCWGCVCEEFCVPKHSKPGCRHCKLVCADCKTCGDMCACDGKPHSKPKRFIWTEWCPTCAKIYHRKKLLKKVETVTVPSYKWVVECMCRPCEASCDLTEVAPEENLPPPPVADAKLLYRVRR